MAIESSALIQKLCNYCHILRDDGLSYLDYVEQLTYLLFLKINDERTKSFFPSWRFSSSWLTANGFSYSFL